MSVYFHELLCVAGSGAVSVAQLIIEDDDGVDLIKRQPRPSI